MPDRLVVDASAMVDLLLGGHRAPAIQKRLSGNELHAPPHFDAEILSALGRLERGSHITAIDAEERLQRLTHAPLERHPLPGLLAGAWHRRHSLRLVDALYVELAMTIGATLITVDSRLAAAAPMAELVTGP